MPDSIEVDEKELDEIYASLANQYRRKALEEIVMGKDPAQAYLEYFVNNWLDNMPWNAFSPKPTSTS